MSDTPVTVPQVGAELVSADLALSRLAQRLAVARHAGHLVVPLAADELEAFVAAGTKLLDYATAHYHHLRQTTPR